MFYPLRSSGADFFCRFAKINLQRINMYCIFVGTKAKKMTTVNFFMPVNLETGHPAFQQPALWIGRAIITQEVDYDENDYPFPVDVTEVTDLFFMPDAGADIRTARRVEIPDNSNAGYTFRYRLEQAAITAYHNPQLQPAEMPDEQETVRL